MELNGSQNCSHIRLNRATREWVIYAPNRRRRPQDFCTAKLSTATPAETAEAIARCPFCPQAARQEEVLFELPALAGNGWQTRVIPNKYPALSPDVMLTRYEAGMYLEMPGYGHHEVIIDTPDHDRDLATMSVPAIAALIETYRQRYVRLLASRHNLFISIFRNHGERAGASLRHPHSQIIATPIVPRYRRWQEDEAQRYFDEWGRCAFCDIVEFEMGDRQRVVSENDDFLAFVPYAAEVPFELWILPKEHSSDFGKTSPAGVFGFASILYDVMSRLHRKLHDPDFNLAIVTPARFKVGEPQLHWYCQIRPRLTISAGFEMGSGISINPSLPEADAAFLLSSD